MPFFKILLISVLSVSILNGAPSSKMLIDRCENLKLDFTIKAETGDQSTLTLKPKGGQAPYSMILCEESGEFVSEDYSKTEYSKLKSGKYFCLLIDNVRCFKRTEIQIP